MMNYALCILLIASTATCFPGINLFGDWGFQSDNHDEENSPTTNAPEEVSNKPIPIPVDDLVDKLTKEINEADSEEQENTSEVLQTLHTSVLDTAQQQVQVIARGVRYLVDVNSKDRTRSAEKIEGFLQKIAEIFKNVIDSICRFLGLPAAFEKADEIKPQDKEGDKKDKEDGTATKSSEDPNYDLMKSQGSTNTSNQSNKINEPDSKKAEQERDAKLAKEKDKLQNKTSVTPQPSAQNPPSNEIKPSKPPMEKTPSKTVEQGKHETLKNPDSKVDPTKTSPSDSSPDKLPHGSAIGSPFKNSSEKSSQSTGEANTAEKPDATKDPAHSNDDNGQTPAADSKANNQSPVVVKSAESQDIMKMLTDATSSATKGGMITTMQHVPSQNPADQSEDPSKTLPRSPADQSKEPSKTLPHSDSSQQAVKLDQEQVDAQIAEITSLVEAAGGKSKEELFAKMKTLIENASKLTNGQANKLNPLLTKTATDSSIPATELGTVLHNLFEKSGALAF